jgi:hypothetical protein
MGHRRPGTPTPMCPDPLTRRFSYFLFDHGGDPLDITPQSVLIIGSPGLELECGMNLQSMLSAIRGTPDEGRQDGYVARSSQGQRPAARTRRATKERNEYALLTTSVLIEENQHFPAGFERPNEANTRSPHRDLLESGGLPTRTLSGRTNPEQHSIQNGLAQLAIDDRNRDAHRRDPGTGQLPVPIMRRHHHDSAGRALALRRLDMLETLDLDALEEFPTTAATKQDEFCQAPSQMDEDLARPFFSAPGILLWHGQGELLTNPACPRPTQAIPQAADCGTQRNTAIDRKLFQSECQNGKKTDECSTTRGDRRGPRGARFVMRGHLALARRSAARLFQATRLGKGRNQSRAKFTGFENLAE